MLYRSTEETSLKILVFLAERKDYPMYDLPKIIEKDYRTVLRHIQSLERAGYIHLARTEKAAKKGKDRKIFALTTLGLAKVLALPSIFGNIEQIANTHSELLPLIFGKWQFFEQHAIKSIVKSRLRKAVENMRFRLFETSKVLRKKDLAEIISLKRVRGSDKYDVDEELGRKRLKQIRMAQSEIVQNTQELTTRRIAKRVLLGFEPSELEEQLKFLSIIKQDEDLRTYVDSELTSLEKDYNRQLESIRLYRKEWESLPLS